MSQNVENIVVEPCIAYWGEVSEESDLGFLEGDIEVGTSEDAVDVTTHQTGTAVLDAIRTGKTAGPVKMTFKETSVERLKKILLSGGATAEARPERTRLTMMSGTLMNSKYFTLNTALDAIKHYVWVDMNSTGVDPAPAGLTEVEVDVAAAATAAQVATAVAAAIDALPGYTATAEGEDVVVTTAADGPVTDATAGNSPATVVVEQQGSGEQVGWGVSKDFRNMSRDAKKLILRPVAEGIDGSFERDLVFWKAYPTINSIKISGENPRTVEVEFRIFQDAARPRETRLFAIGDSR